MLGNLKKKAMDKAMCSVQEKIGPAIQEKMDLFKSLKPSDVNDDEKYGAMVVSPMWAFVKIQSGGAISAAQKFVDVESKFNDGLFDVRNELIVVEDEKVALDPDFSEKVVPTVMKSFNK